MTSSENNTDHAFWRLHIEQWQASGLSQARYCREQELVTHQFRYWKHQFQVGHELVAPVTGFARVQVAASAAPPFSPGLSLCFRDGTQLTGIAQNNMALIKPG